MKQHILQTISILVLLLVSSKCDIFESMLQEFEDKVQEVVLSFECNKSLTELSIFTKLQMFDASSKSLIPTGIAEGNGYDLGHFSECYDLKEEVDGQDVYGKYCLNTVPLTQTNSDEDKNLKMMGSSSPIGMHFGYCLPSTCNLDDFYAIHNYFGKAVYSDQFCYSKGKLVSYTAGEITAIVIFSTIGFFMVVSTIYEIILYYAKMKPHHEVLLAFSVISNSKKLFSFTKNPDQLLCLNGIRALSMGWVIIGHVHSNVIGFGATDNFIDIMKITSEKKNMWLNSAPLSVDTFFALGGLVTVYAFLKATEKGVKFNIFLYYIHRYLRLTPALAMMVLFNATIIHYFGNGPVWGISEDIMKPCQEYWYTAVTYTQNIFNPTSICTPQSWYLSVDMQLFILSPLLLLPLKYWPKYGLFILLGVISLGFIVPFVISYELNLTQLSGNHDADSQEKYMKYYYFQTYGRFGTYVIGMLFGYIIYKYKSDKIFKEQIDNKLNNKMFLLALWTILLGGIVACTYGTATVLTEDSSTLSNSFYTAFGKNCWTIVVCTIVTVCVAGYGGPIDALLSLPVMQFLAKLSYSMYLTHYSLINMRMMNSKVLIHFEEIVFLNYFWSDFMVVLFISFLFCLAFESPMIILEKFVFGGMTKPKSKTNLSA